MKLVIEIDHEHYERIMRIEEGVTVYPTTLALYEAVKNATPLEAQPTDVVSHGRLIDADAFKQYCSEGLEEMKHLFKTDKGLELAIKTTESFLKDIDEQPTVEAQPCISILNRIMEYTYGMLTAEKIGLQHLIKSMMDELSGGDSE